MAGPFYLESSKVIVGLNLLSIFLLPLLKDLIFEEGLAYRLLLRLFSVPETLLVLDLLLFTLRMLSKLLFLFFDSDRLFDSSLFFFDFSLFLQGPRIALRSASDMPSSPIASLVLDLLRDLFDLFVMFLERDLRVLFTELGLANLLLFYDLIERLLSLFVRR